MLCSPTCLTEKTNHAISLPQTGVLVGFHNSGEMWRLASLRRYRFAMSLTSIVTTLLSGASFAALALVSAGPSHAQAPQAQPAQAAPAKAARAPAKAKTAPAEQAEDGQAVTEPKKKDPAEALRSVDTGIKLLQSGKAEQAIQTFSAAIAAGNLPPPQMARALYHRGVAYRKANKPAQAISDLTSALWLKNGLQDADRQDAVKQRADAYREAGLPDQTGEDGRPAGAAQSGRATRNAAAAPGATTGAPGVTTAALAPEPAAQPASTGGLFANLFGGFGKQAQAAAPAATAQAPAKPPAAPAQAASSAWSSEPTVTTAKPTKQPAPVRTAAAAPAAIAAAPQPQSAASAAAPGIHARIALVRTDAEADAIKQRLITQHGAALAGATPTTSQAAFGGMGAFVQVRVGPYANIQQAQAFCTKLKGSGLDCVPVDR
jgi:hypothetical protein